MKDEFLIERLKEIENKLDILNGLYGTKEYYCIYCKSKEYNGKEGIIHTKICPVKQLRVKIKEEIEK